MMRILGIGEYHNLGDLYLRLLQAGHEVRVFVERPEAHGIMAGLVPRVDDWRTQLGWLRVAGRDGVAVFESACNGPSQDQLRTDGFQVIGSSAWGDRLECDRAYGQQVLHEAGLQIAATHAFDDYTTALGFVRSHPARYVYKLDDDDAEVTHNYVGMLEDGRDLLAHLQRETARGARRRFVLMEHVEGIETGVGAYFNGRDFLEPALLDWEHKSFFPGDLGELTGEMGTVVTYRGARKIFANTLGRLRDRLRAGGYQGYINLNTIINERGIWPLEFTCRFGYPGFAICDALHAEGWDSILRKMLRQEAGPIRTHEGFAVGVVLTLPPFPQSRGYAELSRGVPVFMRGGGSPWRRHLHWGEVATREGQLVADGTLGYLAVATGCGPDVASAQAAAYAEAREVAAQNLRYRNDIGARLRRNQLRTLRRLGWFDSASKPPAPTVRHAARTPAGSAQSNAHRTAGA